MNGGLAVISDVPKTLVFRVCRSLNDHHKDFGFRVPPIPESTLTKPPSAELAPGQVDTDSLPPYDMLDEIVERHVEHKQSSARITQETGFDPALVARICRLIDLNEYKRRQLAVGLKITHTAFGPGRRMPIAQRWVR
jgi:NAD+ synthetase